MPMEIVEMTEEQKAEKVAALINAEAKCIYQIVQAVVDAGWEITTSLLSDGEVYVKVKRGGIEWNSDAE